MTQSVIARQIVVAGGVFAPGHLGELTRIVPLEMVDAVVAECGAVQRRVRKLPARVVVYLLLAAALFEPAGYPAVWRKLTGALEGAGAVTVTAAALWQARTRLGPAPLRALFDLLRGSSAAPRTSGSWRGLLVCAIDGTTLDVPDTPGHQARLGNLLLRVQVRGMQKGRDLAVQLGLPGHRAPSLCDELQDTESLHDPFGTLDLAPQGFRGAAVEAPGMSSKLSAHADAAGRSSHPVAGPAGDVRGGDQRRAGR